MNCRALVLAAVAISACSAPAIADEPPAAPDIFGATGLVTVPTAKTLNVLQASGHFHASNEYLTYGAGLGIFPGLEVGITFARGKPGNVLILNPNTKTLVNAKYALFKERDFVPGVAVGVTDLFTDADAGASFYVVASKTLVAPTPLRGWWLAVHAGFGSGIYNQKPFGGVEVGLGYPFTLLTFGLPVSVMVETSDAEFSGGARVYLPLGFTAELNVVRSRAYGGAVSFRHRF
jgi:hypothetical protein